MLAFDHGYFQGPTTGLERPDVTILPLAPHADALMLTRGILRTIIPAASRNAIVMRASGGPSILKELSHEHIAVDIEDALRMNVSAMAVQVFVGGEHESQSVINMTRLVDMGNRYGVPVLAVTAVGKDMVRDAKYIRLATRMCAELGAAFVKTYFVPRLRNGHGVRALSLSSLPGAKNCPSWKRFRWPVTPSTRVPWELTWGETSSSPALLSR